MQQDYPKDKIEIIVVDDGSSDNTKEALSNLIENKTIKYYYQENKGKASATYKAIQNCTGKYIFNLDADDYFLDGKLKKIVDVFESDNRIVHVGSPAKQLLTDNTYRVEPIPADKKNKVLDGNELLLYFLTNNQLFGGGSTFSAKVSVLKKIEIPAEADMFIDEFLVYAMLPFGSSFFFDECLSVWRSHGNNYSIKKKLSDKEIAKEKRLLNSSDAILKYFKEKKFPGAVIKSYSLKNLTAHISHKERLHKKNIKDIANYAYEVFFRIKPNRSLIKNYHVINRLVPAAIFKPLKRIFIKRNNNFLVSDEL